MGTLIPHPADPLGRLVHKKDSTFTELSAGTWIDPAQFSRFHPGRAPTVLGLGLVDGIAALLLGLVTVVTCSADGSTGRVTLIAHGTTATRHLSYLSQPDRIVFGGFVHSAGQATYQVATLGLLVCLAQPRTDTVHPCGEVIGAWTALLQALEAAEPRSVPGSRWNVAQVRRACATTAILSALQRLVDALEWAIRLDPTGHTRRMVIVQVDDAVPDGTDLPRPIPITTLLHGSSGEPPPPPPDPPTAARRRARSPAPSGTGRRRIGRSATQSGSEPEAAAGDGARDQVHRAANTLPSAGGPVVRGPYAARIHRALALPGARLFLVGPTATGKTFQAIDAARQLGWGLEAVTLHPGQDALELIGGYARAVEPVQSNRMDPPDGRCCCRSHTETTDVTRRQQSDWTAVDGPVTRWARRVIGGECVVLLLDELARGHPSCIALVMSLLNRYDRDSITRQGLSIPTTDTASGGFHLVEVWMTKERLVVPAERSKIIGTANLGDRYVGLDLADPAFRRRWDIWLHLGSYPAEIQAAILGDTLGRPGTSPLVAALVGVAGAVETFQREREVLLATLDLATLISWGSITQTLVATGIPLPQAFLAAALDTWIDRLCPLSGADLDAEIRATLTGMVTAHAPTVL